MRRRSFWLGCIVVVVSVSARAQAVDDGGAVDAGPVLQVDAGVPRAPPAPEPPGFVEEHFHGTGVYTGSSHYEVGVVVGQGGLLFADGVAPIPLNGVVLRERNGLISYLLTVFAGQALSSWAIAASAAEITNINTSQTVSRNADGRTATVTTTTTYSMRQLKSQAQVDRETASANSSISQGFVGHTFGELAVYAELPGLTQPARPVGQGYEFSFGGHGELFRLFGLPAVLDVGGHFANVRVPRPQAPGLGGEFLYHSAAGLLARLRLPLTRFAALSVEWILNFLSVGLLTEPEDLLSQGSRPLSPLRVTLDVFATDRFFVRGEATLGALGFSDGRLGLSLTAGVRL
jgi:hypothetical protein